MCTWSAASHTSRPLLLAQMPPSLQVLPKCLMTVEDALWTAFSDTMKEARRRWSSLALTCSNFSPRLVELGCFEGDLLLQITFFELGLPLSLSAPIMHNHNLISLFYAVMLEFKGVYNSLFLLLEIQGTSHGHKCSLAPNRPYAETVAPEQML